MGVNADFHANFGSFLQALTEADKALADFGKGAEDVGEKIGRMADKWGGVRMIQDANALVKVVNDLGGATMLTEKEQAKLNASLTEAIAKYKAIGAEVPADMQKLADETQHAAKSTTDWISTLKDLAGAFGIAFSVGAVVNFGKELFADAQALDTLSKQTRTSIQDLVILRGATESYGISAEEIGRALFQLRTRIAGDDQSVAAAYAKMGLSMDEVRAKQNDSIGLLELTQRGLASVSSETQDLAAQDLYGGKLASGMIGLAKGFDDLVEKSREANKGVGESTKVMAEYADAIDRAERSIKNIATVVIGAPLKGMDALSGAVKENVSWWKLAAAAFEDWRLNAGGEVFAGVANGLAAVNKGQQDIALTTATVTTEITSARIATDALAKAQQDAAKAQQEAARAQQDADKIALDSYEKRVKSLELVTQATLKAYSFDGQISQLNALMQAEEDLARSVYAQIESEKLRMKILEDLAARRTAIAQQQAALEAKHAGVVNQQVLDELAARTKILEAYGQQADGTLKIDSAQQRLQTSLDELHRKKQEGISQYYQEQALMDQFLKDQEAEIAATHRQTAANDEETASIRRKADARDSFSLAGASAVPDKFAGWSQERMRLAGYIDLYGKVTASGEAAGLGDSGGPIRPTGQRASGGPVESGGAYLVGERGPELFVPSQSGSIVPNGAGTVVHNTFNIVDTESNIARRVAEHITRSVMRSTRMS